MNPFARWLWSLWAPDPVETREVLCIREAAEDGDCWCDNCRNACAQALEAKYKQDGKNADKRHAS